MKKLIKFIIPLLVSVMLLSSCSERDVMMLLSLLEEYASSTAVMTTTDFGGDLVVDFIDVGQADCSLIHLPNGEKMMIDAGIADAYPVIEAQLEGYGIERIDYLVGTHPHSDHIGAMDKVIKNYEIGEIYMPRATNDTYNFENVLKAIKKKGYSINATTAGMVIYEDEETKIETFAPNSDEYESLNDWSIVIKITYKDTAFLFTGDAEKLSENEMLGKGYDLSADVIKLGHHGSSTSNTNNFLKAVNPELAVISCGINNDYGHPHKEVVKRLDRLGIQYLRTDECGTVTVTSDGENISVSTEK